MNKQTVDFLDHLKNERNYSAQTIDSYSRDIEKFFKYLNKEGVLMDQVDILVIRNFLTEELISGVSKRSCKRRLCALKHFYAYMVNNSILETNPCVLVTAPKSEKKMPSVLYKKQIEQLLDVKGKPGNLIVTDFISRMDQAYCLADLVISRAGAGSISELCLLGKPSILVPSPNVAEDHQTHNAMALVNKDAAILVRDEDAAETIIPLALDTVADTERLQQLGQNAAAMALRDSAHIIAQEVIKLAQQKLP